MLTVTDEEIVFASLSDVFSCFWDATLWPVITSHVKRVEMLEAGDRFQRLRMTVEANGMSHAMESERWCEPFQSITYRQTTPPVFLREHAGEWSFHEDGGSVVVRLTHQVVVDEPRAIAALKVRDAAEASRVIAETLKANGARTLAAVKAHLEARKAGMESERARV